MIGRNPLERRVSSSRSYSGTVTKAALCIGVGVVAGAVGGVFFGEACNHYFTVLKEAPAVIKYAVDGASAFVGAGVGGNVGGLAALVATAIKVYRNK